MTLAAGGSSESSGNGGVLDGGATEKAQRFFDRGRDVADAENFDYAIELFIHGLSLDPDDVSAHKELRLIALERTARGGNDIPAFDKLKLRETITRSTDPTKSMLIAEKMLAFDPSNPEWIKCCGEYARRAELVRTAEWFARLAGET